MSNQPFTWFRNSPDVGPACTCSVCGRPILSGIPVRLFSADGKKEARFHMTCYNRISAVQLYPVDADAYGQED